MTQLNYHVDVHYIMPREMFATPSHGDLLKQAGIEAETMGNTRLLFRDPKTAEALRKAPAWLQKAMVDAGFGLMASGETRPVEEFDELEDRHRMKKFAKLLKAFEDIPSAWDPIEGAFQTRMLYAHELRMQALAAMKQAGPTEKDLIPVFLESARQLEQKCGAPSPDWPTADHVQARPVWRPRENPVTRFWTPMNVVLALVIIGLPFYGHLIFENAIITALLGQ